ncbi:hypothetical protein KQI61_15970 [Anaerocolumna aminovalerica]|uniref:ABC transporter permease/M1 family aminopeptidase n=1 Tax=Anaerocolumna aminovalerica TaxID=1527 RepID=UPI001C0EFE94|nr:M1 family aminopeptidase [Anaerocolumna aminovalerica]MBU5333697.1 hypothetical protein [Anaerocolumna aminovalerica]
MNATEKFSKEVQRILSERLTWLIIALTAAGAVWFSLNGTGRTASDAFIVNAAKSSAFLGAFLFTMLSLVQFHRDYKNNTDVIILTSTDPVHHQIRRALALICIGIVTTLLISLFALPYGIIKTGDYFQITTFLTAWFLIFLCALVFAVLLASGFYMLTKRMEAAFLIMAGLIFLSKALESMFTLNPSYLFYWVQTSAGSFSDLITNQFQIDMLLWNRLFCLLFSIGIWALGLCSFRRYGRGLIGSFFTNCQRVWIPALLVAALSFSCISYIFEPVFDDSKPMDFSGMMSSGTGIITSFSSEPQVGNPDLTLMDKVFDLVINAKGRRLSGVAKYKIKNATGKIQILPVQINTGLTLGKVKVNGVEVKAVQGETGELSTANWSIELPAASEYEIEIGYSGRMGNDNTILQRVKYGIAEGYVWLPADGFSPVFDINVSEDNTFSGMLSLDNNLEPVFAKGKGEKVGVRDGKTQWSFTGNTGTQNTSIFAAEYMTRSFEAGGLNIELKYFRKHHKSITDMDAVNVIKEAIDYFTKAYGPLIYNKNLTMLELPAYVSGGFAAGNMSAMDETNFNAEGYLPLESLSPDQGGGIDVLIHEIAHQWWGLATMPMQDGVSNWSAEGITCYSTYSFMKQYFGEDYVNERYLKVWQKGLDTYQNAFYIQHPEYLGKLSEADASNIMASFEHMRLYDIMPLMMLKGEKSLGGSEAFQKKLSQLYMAHLGQPITYDDFLNTTGLTKEAIEIE